ncbi:alpha-E domain-containing protein [Microcella alkalica]|uniref:alpha-E domain-containing protein n=1 Tax=Microcella alkalica TaxID=355930 RepID=UPI00145E0389|nr:alpha-E domain-containing protein [Microcella alkalica]
MTGVGEPLVRGAASTTSAVPAHLLALGRAIERADATARILEAHLLLARDDHWLDDAAAARLLLASCGVDAPADPPSTARAADRLTADRAHPASIAHALVEARDAARLARESLPAELADMLVATRARLPRKVVGPRVGDFLAWVRERSAIAVGLVESAVARGGAYELITLGRRLERAVATSRVLAAHAGEPEASIGWMSVLRSAGAHESHVRAHRGAPTAAATIELLVLDERFPRSVAQSLARAEAALAGVPGPPALSALPGAGAAGEAGSSRVAVRALAAARAAADALGGVVVAVGHADDERAAGHRRAALVTLLEAVVRAADEVTAALSPG